MTRDKIDTLCIHRGFSSAKAASLLGYVPRVDYAEGLAHTFAWMTEAGLLSLAPPRQSPIPLLHRVRD